MPWSECYVCQDPRVARAFPETVYVSFSFETRLACIRAKTGIAGHPSFGAVRLSYAKNTFGKVRF